MTIPLTTFIIVIASFSIGAVASWLVSKDRIDALHTAHAQLFDSHLRLGEELLDLHRADWNQKSIIKEAHDLLKDVKAHIHKQDERCFHLTKTLDKWRPKRGEKGRFVKS